MGAVLVVHISFFLKKSATAPISYLAVGETLILLHPPLPLVGVSTWMWKCRTGKSYPKVSSPESLVTLCPCERLSETSTPGTCEIPTELL